MISALGTCRLCWRLKIFFKHQLSGGEIKQIIWQAVYIFRSIRSGGRVPPCRRAADQSELSWDNPSCQSVKTAAWWDPATARIIFWISFSPHSQAVIVLGYITHTNTLDLQCSECSSDSHQSPEQMFIKYSLNIVKIKLSLGFLSIFVGFFVPIFSIADLHSLLLNITPSSEVIRRRRMI